MKQCFSKHFVHFKELAALTRNTIPVSKNRKKPLTTAPLRFPEDGARQM
jgi:hypothetical protein